MRSTKNGGAPRTGDMMIGGGRPPSKFVVQNVYGLDENSQTQKQGLTSER